VSPSIATSFIPQMAAIPRLIGNNFGMHRTVEFLYLVRNCFRFRSAPASSRRWGNPPAYRKQLRDALGAVVFLHIFGRGCWMIGVLSGYSPVTGTDQNGRQDESNQEIPHSRASLWRYPSIPCRIAGLADNSSKPDNAFRYSACCSKKTHLIIPDGIGNWRAPSGSPRCPIS